MTIQVKESLEFSYEQHPFLLHAEHQDTPLSGTNYITFHLQELYKNNILH